MICSSTLMTKKTGEYILLNVKYLDPPKVDDDGEEFDKKVFCIDRFPTLDTLHAYCGLNGLGKAHLLVFPELAKKTP